jgi:hypothetical protein
LQHKESEGCGTYRAELQQSQTALIPADTFPAKQVILPARRQEQTGKNWPNLATTSPHWEAIGKPQRRGLGDWGSAGTTSTVNPKKRPNLKCKQQTIESRTDLTFYCSLANCFYDHGPFD